MYSYNEMLVAQNCPNYKTKAYKAIEDMSYISESCSNCRNYKNGKCESGLFNYIEDKIRFM